MPLRRLTEIAQYSSGNEKLWISYILLILPHRSSRLYIHRGSHCILRISDSTKILLQEKSDIFRGQREVEEKSLVRGDGAVTEFQDSHLVSHSQATYAAMLGLLLLRFLTATSTIRTFRIVECMHSGIQINLPNLPPQWKFRSTLLPERKFQFLVAFSGAGYEHRHFCFVLIKRKYVVNSLSFKRAI